MSIKYLLKKNDLFNKFRNSLNLPPSIYLVPNIKKTSVSDFFYFNLTNNFDTKIMLFNLSSHVLPDIKQKEIVKFFIFDNKGILIKNYDFDLEYQETLEIKISDLVTNCFGSFFAFHIFENFGDLLEKNSFISERGYVAHRINKSLWSFVHGNHNAAYLDNNFNIHSIIAKSFLKNNFYIPQVSFIDQDEFDLVFNNPSKESCYLEVIEKDDGNKIIIKKIISINPLGTNIYKSKNKANSIEINSKIVLNRPLIIKYYKNSIDIFHG